ncbi:hypothetical protein JTE90_026088 [Oedothorax gibbosus]|uniref:Enoyl-CoA hydratase domain-containing protein 3, mitochondrial n=1 Tax=Oedothorax gibbosus TaxID=931172 RepID=A0AAV6UNF1_9ARAC|nr:hypothetical protein JTE90_026088 [Oedothorax gibbosus]
MALFTKLKVWKTLLTRTCSTQSELTLVTKQNGVKRIVLNNPKKRNALSSAMLQKLNDDIFEGVDDINLRCIVLESKGPVFSSGHDLKEIRQLDSKKQEEIFTKSSSLMVGLRHLPVPVIAVVNGLATAAGCQLVASCDITIASSKSQFSTPGASVGLFCSTPGVAVSRNVPLKMASYMLLTGNNLNANEALQCGLVSKIAEEHELDVEVEKVLNSLLCKSRSVLALGKKLFYDQLDKSIEEAYRMATNTMVENLKFEDTKEGISAFFEKLSSYLQPTTKCYSQAKEHYELFCTKLIGTLCFSNMN